MHGGVLAGIGECMIELSQAGEGLFRKSYAGDVFNTLWYARAALSNSWTTRFVSAVGTDLASDEMLAFMADAGIDCSQMQRLESRRPGLYMIHLDGGERSFSYWRENSAARLLAADRPRLMKAIDDASAVYFSGITLAILSEDDASYLLDCLGTARAAGKIVAFDSNIRPALWGSSSQMRQFMERAAAVSTIALPSYDDERSNIADISREHTVRRYADAGVEIVVLKDGDGDVLICTPQGLFQHPTHQVQKVLDSTGAGDSFNGAFLACYLQTGDCAQAVVAGQARAATVVQHHGALVTC